MALGCYEQENLKSTDETKISAAGTFFVINRKHNTTIMHSVCTISNEYTIDYRPFTWILNIIAAD